jgi:choline dehydrogenase-like flavoprotein
MDLTYLPDAVAAGARIAASSRVVFVEVGRGGATGVEATTDGGGRLRVRAKDGVVLAASAIQTPALLLASRITQGPVGEGLQGHPGASVGGHFDEPVRMWTGATQGHEVIGLRREGLKFEALGFDMTIAATRAFGVGRDLAREVRDLAHFVDWGAAIKAEARGRVRPGRRRARVSGYALTRADLARMRRGIRVLGEMLFAAGAREVIPGVHGWHGRVTDRAVMARFEDEAPWDPRCYTAGVSHLFGTCPLGSDPARSVVRTDFRHHAIDRLWVADSSVFPTNTGVNPQTSILALATLCGRGIARARSRSSPSGTGTGTGTGTESPGPTAR